MSEKLTGAELKASFGVANTYIGALIGPALVAGSLATFYFLPWGAWALILPFIGMGIIALEIYFGAQIPLRYKIYEYGEYAKKMYFGNKILCVLLEIYLVVTLVIGAATVLSIAGTFMNELCGMTPFMGMLLMVVVALVLTLFKDGLIRVANSIMSVIMIVAFFAVSILILVLYGDQLIAVISSWHVPEGAKAGGAISQVCAFGFLSCAMAVTLCCVEQPIVKKKQTTWIAIFAWVMGSVTVVLSCIIFLPFLAESLTSLTPMVDMMNNHLVNFAAWIPPVYYATMIFAIVSSLIPNMFMITSRVEKWLPTTISGRNRMLICGALFGAVILGLAMFGVEKLMGVGYTAMSWAGVPLVLIPMCIIWPIKHYREDKAKKAALAAGKEVE